MPNALTRFAETVRSYWTGPMTTRDPALASALGLGPTTTGLNITSDTAFNSSAFWSAVSIIGCDVASLPLEQFKRSPNGDNEPFVDSKTYELVHNNPNPEMTSIVMRETMQSHALTWGNAFAEIEWNGAGKPLALWPLTPDRVTPFRQDRRVKYRVSNTSMPETTLEASNILHVPGLGFDGLTGYSVIEKARESIGMGLAMQRFGGTFFGNGSTFGGVLSHPQNLTKEVKQGIRESIDAIHTGVDRAHKFIIVGGGMKYDKLGIPPNDAQFLESRRFEIEEIARWFHMPQHKLNGLDHATFSNIEHLDLEYYKSCLRGWLVRWEQELNRKLIPPLERKSQWFKHNVEGFLRGDSAARADFYTKQFGVGALSINNILALENRNGIGADGDTRFVPANMMPLDRALHPPEPPPPPALPTVTEVPPKTLPPKRDVVDVIEAEVQLDTVRAALDAERLARETAEQQARRLAVKHARATAHVTAAQAAQAEADSKRQASEGNLDQALARAALAEARAASLAADVRTQTDAAAAAQAACDEAQAAVAFARGAQAQAEAAAAQAAADRTAADTAKADAETACAALQAADRQRAATLLAAHRALIVDALGRMLRREADKARAAQATPDKLRAWMDRFYPLQAEMCRAALLPAIRAHLAWTASGEDPDTVTAAIVQQHIDESQRQLRLVLMRPPGDFAMALETTVRRWEVERADRAADALLCEALVHVGPPPPGPDPGGLPVSVSPITVTSPPIHIDFHHHATAGSRSVRFTRNVDGSIQSASIDDQED